MGGNGWSCLWNEPGGLIGNAEWSALKSAKRHSHAGWNSSARDFANIAQPFGSHWAASERQSLCIHALVGGQPGGREIRCSGENSGKNRGARAGREFHYFGQSLSDRGPEGAAAKQELHRGVNVRVKGGTHEGACATRAGKIGRRGCGGDIARP